MEWFGQALERVVSGRRRGVGRLAVAVSARVLVAQAPKVVPPDLVGLAGRSRFSRAIGRLVCASQPSRALSSHLESGGDALGV